MSYAEWREIMNVTLDGAFHCVKACLPYLKKSGAGTIVNIGGLSAHTGARDRAHVVTAKAGIIGFTRALAHDLAADGITVNCVVPGLIGTPRPKDKPEPAHHLIHQTITGERGRPEDVAAAVRFLCGPAARYINGQAIHSNGGAYLGRRNQAAAEQSGAADPKSWVRAPQNLIRDSRIKSRYDSVFEAKVRSGSRKENASKQKIRASVPILISNRNGSKKGTAGAASLQRRDPRNHFPGR